MKFTKFAIVLVFFLSLTACVLTAFLSAIRENEKEKRLTLQTIRVQLEERLNVLQEEKTNYQKQVDSLNTQLQTALSEGEKTRADLDKIRAEITERDKALEQKKRDIEELQRVVQISQARNRELEGELEEYERVSEESRKSWIGATGELGPEYGPFLKTGEKEKEKQAPAFTIVPAETKSPEAVSPVKPVEKSPETKQTAPTSESLQAGRILLINRKFNFVVMNMGSKQGLKVGDAFMVHEGNESVAKVEIEKLYDDFAAAKILEHYGDKSLLKEGNLVTRL